MRRLRYKTMCTMRNGSYKKINIIKTESRKIFANMEIFSSTTDRELIVCNQIRVKIFWHENIYDLIRVESNKDDDDEEEE